MKKDNERFQALYLINQGMTATDIAESLNCSYSSVLRWKREYEDAKIAGTLKAIMNIPTEVIEQMGDMIASRSAPGIDGEVQLVTKQLTGLQALNEDFQKTASTLDRRIRTMALGAESTAEILDLTACLVKLQEAFFDKKAVPAAVPTADANTGTSSYGKFLSDKPTV